MNPLILTRQDLLKPYANNGVHAIELGMFAIASSLQQQAETVLFIDNGPGAIRLCKVLKDRHASL
jgi:hypothetical protein